jgi:hypothetical protein
MSFLNPPASHEVEMELAHVQVAERGDHLRRPARMHVDRLQRDQCGEPLRALGNDLRDRPWIDVPLSA